MCFAASQPRRPPGSCCRGAAGRAAAGLWPRAQRPAQRPRRHPRHAARRPRRRLRLRCRAHAGARRPGGTRRPLCQRHHHDAADALGAHQPLHRHVAHHPRRARQHRLLRGRGRDDAGRGVEGPRLSHRRLRRRLRARRALGHRAGVRPLFRRVRPQRRRRPRPGRDPAPRRRGRGPGHGVAGPAGHRAVLRLGAPVRPAHALRRADGVRQSLPRHPRRRLRRRDCLHRQPGGPAAGGADQRRPAREHHRGGAGRPRRAARRAPRAVARFLRLRRLGAGAAHHGRAGRGHARRARSGADRGRHADGAGPGRGRAAGGRAGRVVATGARRPAPIAAGVFGVVVSALPLRLEPAAGGARRHPQVHPRPHTRALRHHGRSR